MNTALHKLKIQNLKSVHIIGICGTLMGSFAAYLKRQGIQVSGSDQNVYPPMSDVLEKAGIKLMSGYQASNLSGLDDRPDLVIIGNVISRSNPEASYVMDQGYTYASLPEAMEVLLLKDTTNLVVAGTHGKTTTSSLLAHVLNFNKLSPSYFIGGVSQDLPNSFEVSPTSQAQNFFVLEGDEYDTAFWDKVPKFNHYLPDQVILTSVEYDHADIYPDLESVKKAFIGLMDRIRPNGKLIYCKDYPVIEELIERSNLNKSVSRVSYGFSKSADFQAINVKTSQELTSFEVWNHKMQKVETRIHLNLSGNHNVLNALAVWIQCHSIGIQSSQVADALQSFRGVKRRQEVRGEVRGVMVIDDFAHHPTAVKETLRGLKLKYSDRRIVVVFEPRSATSRRKVFQKEYASAFEASDLIYIMKPYDQSKIVESDQFSSEELIEDLKKLGKKAFLMNEVDSGVKDVVSQARTGDLIAVLSNGGFGGFIPKLINTLGTNLET